MLQAIVLCIFLLIVLLLPNSSVVSGVNTLLQTLDSCSPWENNGFTASSHSIVPGSAAALLTSTCWYSASYHRDSDPAAIPGVRTAALFLGLACLLMPYME